MIEGYVSILNCSFPFKLKLKSKGRTCVRNLYLFVRLALCNQSSLIKLYKKKHL